jgi:ATP-dependent helicase/nuclease subunit B
MRRAVVAGAAGGPRLRWSWPVARMALEWVAASGYATDACCLSPCAGGRGLPGGAGGLSERAAGGRHPHTLWGDKARAVPMVLATLRRHPSVRCMRRTDAEDEAAPCRRLRAAATWPPWPQPGGAGRDRPRAHAPCAGPCWARRACACAMKRGGSCPPPARRRAHHDRAAAARDAPRDAVLDWLKHTPALHARRVSTAGAWLRKAVVRDWPAAVARQDRAPSPTWPAGGHGGDLARHPARCAPAGRSGCRRLRELLQASGQWHGCRPTPQACACWPRCACKDGQQAELAKLGRRARAA